MRASSLRLALPVVLVLSGCLDGFRVGGTPAAGPLFRPEQFFAGVTYGEGIVAARGRADRAFHVTSAGHSESDGNFVLDQTITYADGEVERRSFRVRRVDEHEYTGRLTGASSPVSARAEGNSFHVRYTISKPAVTMEQWVYLQPDGRTALSRATVSLLGIPVARLSETIRRP
ncbi:MAG: DUF3833 family protein [Gemmatimonadaceae bacterium]|nr:DUF3833 family protein [Gemmatimonadaceae bacterium]